MNTKVIANLDEIFLPRSVAVVGSSPKEFYTLSLMMGKLRDHFYPVNPNYQEIHGIKCHASILDIAEPVDYVILDLPARYVLKTVDECIRKGVKCIHAFTSGFSETGLPEGIQTGKAACCTDQGQSPHDWPQLHGHILP